jgi:hypothetical protein
VAEKDLNFRDRYTAFSEATRVFVPQIMPVQIDRVEGASDGACDRRPVAGGVTPAAVAESSR